MSVQFGKCNFDGKAVDPQDLHEARPVLAPYGPDGEVCICKGNFGILYRPLHTTSESRRENQPCVTQTGAIITWDGRLDNRKDLIKMVAGDLPLDSTDLEIVGAGYDRRGLDILPDLIGDWALSIWNPSDESLILAKDPIGTRHLYYSIDKEQVTWCTILDPIVLFARHSFKLEEEYVAGWLSFLPATYLAPYVGVHSVSPASFVRLTRANQTTYKYWDFDPERRIRYKHDAEYEEHFRSVFASAVERRLRSEGPILAELSGGVDSSSIICVADNIISDIPKSPSRLDTISYYDDSEPNWNERPFFTKVEERRGRTGCHINVGSPGVLNSERSRCTFAATPNSASHWSNEISQQVRTAMTSQGNRVLLSGIGGDEVLGGVPTPMPQLMDLVASMRTGTLIHELKIWALNKRKPWIHLLLGAIRGFFPPTLVGVSEHMRPAPWLSRNFARRHRAALTGYPSRVKIGGSLPSFQQFLITLEGLRRQLHSSALPSDPPHEIRYPYLDRDLIEFVSALPREQLVRPGQRRSLMRRSLAGIVPDEILNRKRKAFVARSPTRAASAEWASLMERGEHSLLASLGIIDSKRFDEALDKARHGQVVRIVDLMRTIGIEFWLRELRSDEVLIDWPRFGGGESKQLFPRLSLRKPNLMKELS